MNSNIHFLGNQAKEWDTFINILKFSFELFNCANFEAWMKSSFSHIFYCVFKTKFVFPACKRAADNKKHSVAEFIFLRRQSFISLLLLITSLQIVWTEWEEKGPFPYLYWHLAFTFALLYHYTARATEWTLVLGKEWWGLSSRLGPSHPSFEEPD